MMLCTSQHVQIACKIKVALIDSGSSQTLELVHIRVELMTAKYTQYTKAI